MIYATSLRRSSSPFVMIYSASVPPLPILQRQVPEFIVVSGQLNRRHRTPTHPTHSEKHAGPFVESCWGATEVVEGIDPRSRTPVGRGAQDVHQFITRKHGNTARCPNGEVLPVYAIIRPVQTFKLAPKAIR